jgi:hypothetical protein
VVGPCGGRVPDPRVVQSIRPDAPPKVAGKCVACACRVGVVNSDGAAAGEPVFLPHLSVSAKAILPAVPKPSSGADPDGRTARADRGGSSADCAFRASPGALDWLEGRDNG